MLKLLKITDNGGETTDRYTAYFSDDYALSMSESPLSSRGVCLSLTSKPEWLGCDTGKNVKFSRLPAQVQKAIRDFMG